MIKNNFRRTAEFVSPKHPDKICDIISDTILDTYLTEDKDSRCAIETAAGHGKVFITGEVTSKAMIDNAYIKDYIVRKLTDVPNKDIFINLVTQSPEIARGVDVGGAGDQGIMVGYACNECLSYMPNEYELARLLNKTIYDNHYQTDGKTQVTLDEANKKVIVVASFQHSSTKHLESIIRSFFNTYGYEATIHANPAGEWTVGGLEADAGLTGRKIVVDAYGPRVPVGGGAFSGKDATKVDRSAAYMARKIAKDLLQLESASEVLVRLAYAIGYEFPIEASAIVDGKYRTLAGMYDLRPAAIIERLDLRKPIYRQTAQWGHFGNRDFTWER